MIDRSLGASVNLRFTTRREGDLRPLGPNGNEVAVPDDVLQRWRAVCDVPWTWLRQMHGTRVVTVTSPGGGAGEPADAAVTTCHGAALAIFTADCAPVALVAAEVMGVAHAGWKGLYHGVIERAVEAMRALGAEAIAATVGPCVHPECYEVDPAHLDRQAARLGDGVRATTAAGRPAFDLPAAVVVALAAAGIDDVVVTGPCTACSPQYFSHRARAEAGRQALVAWR